MSCQTPIKDPNAVLDYVVDWAPWLADSGSDTITAVVWTATGLTITSSSFTTTDATVRLSGGTSGTLYTVSCRITTAGGRIDERSFKLRVRDK
jgi:hypothetical protein